MIYRVEADKEDSETSNPDAPASSPMPLCMLHPPSSTSSGVTNQVDSPMQTSCVASSSTSLHESDMSSSDGRTDLGSLILTAGGSWDKLNALISKLPDDRRKQFLCSHSRPSSTDPLHSHPVTKLGRTWNVSFQTKWLEQFPWLSYSTILSGGICRYCILFPEPPARGNGLDGAVEQAS